MIGALEIFLSTVIGFFFLALVFVPMEKVFPAKKEQGFFRKNWLVDFCFFIGQYFLWSALVLFVLFYFEHFILSYTPHYLQVAIRSQSYWLQLIELILLSDFLIYWGHRLQHSNSFLWRFHKIHHSAEHMDWLAAHREHPLDSVYTLGLINLPAFIMGFPLESIAGFVAFRGIWAIYIHSNVRLPIGPLKLLIGAPELHHWHHDLDRHAGNYANLSPIMDLLFGTYSCPPTEPEAFGIREETPQSYLGQLIEPLLPRKIWERYRSVSIDDDNG